MVSSRGAHVLQIEVAAVTPVCTGVSPHGCAHHRRPGTSATLRAAWRGRAASARWPGEYSLPEPGQVRLDYALPDYGLSLEFGPSDFIRLMPGLTKP
jgi:hypothetical protein